MRDPRMTQEDENFWRSLPARDKVAIIQAMGFSPTWDPHRPECPRSYDSGNRCNCVPDATVWGQPGDVDEFRGETWEDRLESAKRKKDR